MIEFTHSLTREPGTWKGTTTGGAVLQCPVCGRGFAVGPGSTAHILDAQSCFSPSVVCPHLGCTFHKFVRLGAWRPHE